MRNYVNLTEPFTIIEKITVFQQPSWDYVCLLINDKVRSMFNRIFKKLSMRIRRKKVQPSLESNQDVNFVAEEAYASLSNPPLILASTVNIERCLEAATDTSEEKKDDEFNFYDTSKIVSLKKLDKGACGEIFSGKLQDTEIVLKKILSGNKREQFNTEIETLKQLKHDNIIKLYGFQKDKNNVIDGIIMERMDQSLFSMIRSKEYQNRSDDLVQSIMYQTYSAINYMHENGFIHRDIKPENILFSGNKENFKAKLCDFGFSVKCNGIFTDTILHGTAGFLSPESISSFQYSTKSDNFSAGCTFEELITGKDAYPGNTHYEILNKITRGYRKNLPLISNSIFKQIIEESSRNDPELRPTARECMLTLQPK